MVEISLQKMVENQCRMLRETSFSFHLENIVLVTDEETSMKQGDPLGITALVTEILVVADVVRNDRIWNTSGTSSQQESLMDQM